MKEGAFILGWSIFRPELLRFFHFLGYEGSENL